VAAEGVIAAVNITGALNGDGLVDELSAAADACLTFWVNVEEELLLQLESPP
jgi:hypothetical protein